MTAVLPVARTCPFAPPAEHTRLRETEPVARVTLPSGDRAWALSRIADIRTMLTDPRFTADRTHPGVPRLEPGQRAVGAAVARTMVSLDPPEHGRIRKPVTGEFSARRIAALAPGIQRIVDARSDTPPRPRNGRRPWAGSTPICTAWSPTRPPTPPTT